MEDKAKTIVDSVGDSFVEILRVVPRIGISCASAATNFASRVDADLANIEAKMPEKPLVLVATPFKIVGHGIQFVGEIIAPAADVAATTARGIDSQVKRLTGGLDRLSE